MDRLCQGSLSQLVFRALGGFQPCPQLIIFTVLKSMAHHQLLSGDTLVFLHLCKNLWFLLVQNHFRKAIRFIWFYYSRILPLFFMQKPYCKNSLLSKCSFTSLCECAPVLGEVLYRGPFFTRNIKHQNKIREHRGSNE